MSTSKDSKQTQDTPKVKYNGSVNNHGTKKGSAQNEEMAANLREIIKPLQVQISRDIVSHNEKVKYPNGIPTLLETETCAKNLQKQFPALKIDIIINVLHSIFDTSCESKPAQFYSHTPPTEQIFSYDMPYNLTKTDYSQVNTTVRAKQSIKKFNEDKINQQQRIAISYLNYGYGVRVLREYIDDPQINATRYNNTITYIMKIAFRRVEDFMDQLNRKVVKINTEQQKLLRAPLVNCQKWLPPDELQVFYRFIKLACRLEGQLDIDQNAAINLYSSCIRQLHQRREREKQGDRRRCSKRKEDYEETKEKSVRSQDSWEPRTRNDRNIPNRYAMVSPYHI